MRTVLRSLFATCCACLAACTPLHEVRCAVGERPSVDDTLIFGTAMPLGSVSVEQWDIFLQTMVTPRFPQGFTVWPAAGQWRAEDGRTIREQSYVLRFVHQETGQTERAVREVIDAYKNRFQQEAVLRISSKSCSSF